MAVEGLKRQTEKRKLSALLVIFLNAFQSILFNFSVETQFKYILIKYSGA